jgi:hypothetical protein
MAYPNGGQTFCRPDLFILLFILLGFSQYLVFPAMGFTRSKTAALAAKWLKL